MRQVSLRQGLSGVSGVVLAFDCTDAYALSIDIQNATGVAGAYSVQYVIGDSVETVANAVALAAGAHTIIYLTRAAPPALGIAVPPAGGTWAAGVGFLPQSVQLVIGGGTTLLVQAALYYDD